MILSLLYLDTDKLGLLVKQIDKAIREFLPSKDERYVHEGLATLGVKHIGEGLIVHGLEIQGLSLELKRLRRRLKTVMFCEFLPSKDERYVHEGLATLDELAEVHVYFELVRLEWRGRVVEVNGCEGASKR